MSVLTPTDKEFISENTRDLILSSGQTAKLYRPKSGEENLYGTDDLQADLVAENVPIELVTEPQEKLKEANIDAVVSVLPELDIRESDRLELDGVLYKVLNITEQNAFGVISHKTVKLARMYSDV